MFPSNRRQSKCHWASAWPLTHVAIGKVHRRGSPVENGKMYRENRRVFCPRGEPVGSHPLSRATFSRCRSHLKTSKTSEKMAFFHASPRRNFWHLLPPRPRGTPQVRRLDGQPNAKILGKNEPHEELRATNLLDRRAAPTGSARKCRNAREKRHSRSTAAGELVRSTPEAQSMTVVEISKPSGKAGLAIRHGRRTCRVIAPRPQRERAPVLRRWELTSFDPSHPPRPARVIWSRPESAVALAARAARGATNRRTRRPGESPRAPRGGETRPG